MATYFTTQSTLHVALIMDGNGRWAARRGWPRLAGHRAGVETVRRLVDAAPSMGIGTLTLYAFSSDNWGRPAPEVSGLMRLFRQYLRREPAELARRGVRLQVIGRRDRLDPGVRAAIETAETRTAHGSRLALRLAVDYSSRDAIARAASDLAGAGEPITRESLARSLGGPDVDLLIRTSGEQRLSDYLLWENAYAEFVFTPTLWPDFGPDGLAAALDEFRSRHRRWGKLQPAV
jgi:undecaprenyl diphosphate synthase